METNENAVEPILQALAAGDRLGLAELVKEKDEDVCVPNFELWNMSLSLQTFLGRGTSEGLASGGFCGPREMAKTCSLSSPPEELRRCKNTDLQESIGCFTY